MKKIFSVAKVPIAWEEVDVTPVKGTDGKTRVPQSVVDSLNRNTIGLKGNDFRILNL